jgi:hypothetical protein
MIDYRMVGIIKGAIALSAAVVLAYLALAGRGGRTPRRAHAAESLLVGLGLVGALCWWNLGQFHYGAYVHMHEQYHYYIGAKYFHELGYTRLYQCTAIADDEAGLGDAVRQRWVRNLSTNALERGGLVLLNPTTCTSHFTAERWASFTRDIAWFRERTAPDRWARSQLDHGYNATPVWGIVGGLLASFSPASHAQVLFLSLLDPALIGIMWIVIWRAFGLPTACVAAIWWGTNYPARFYWTGGAFLRTDWLLMAVAGIALVKCRRPAAGGFALTYAALLRIFPGLIVVGLCLKAAIDMCRRRSLKPAPAHLAFAGGCVLALCLLVPLSAIAVGGGVSGGADAWSGFVANSRKHLETPLTNNIGLKTVVAYDPATRVELLEPYWVDSPLDTWTAARRRIFGERQVLYWVLVLVFVAGLARAVRDQDDWVALAIGVGLIPIATELTSYYYSVLLIAGFLWTRDRWIGVGLCLVSACTGVIAAGFRMEDDIHAAISASIVLFVVWATLRLGSRSLRDETSQLQFRKLTSDVVPQPPLPAARA